MTISELERKINSQQFIIERLTERIEKLERTKADKMRVYENWNNARV